MIKSYYMLTVSYRTGSGGNNYMSVYDNYLNKNVRFYPDAMEYYEQYENYCLSQGYSVIGKGHNKNQSFVLFDM